MWTLNRTIDLTRPDRAPRRAEPIPLMYPGDNQAHTLTVTVLNDGAAATLTGTPYGCFTRADGQTVVVEGTLTGNVIAVTLTRDCYAIRGALRAVIRLGDGIASETEPCASLLELNFHIRDGFGETYVGPDVFPTLETLVNGGIVDIVYPVGSIYMSASSASPATLFPGTAWTQIQDTFLLAAGSTYAAGATGGEAEHTLTKPELPQIYGRVNYHGMTSDGRGGTFVSSATGDFKVVAQQSVYKLFTTATSGATSIGGHELDVGENQPHNNMPPYLAVYVWQRTA